MNQKICAVSIAMVLFVSLPQASARCLENLTIITHIDASIDQKPTEKHFLADIQDVYKKAQEDGSWAQKQSEYAKRIVSWGRMPAGSELPRVTKGKEKSWTIPSNVRISPTHPLFRAIQNHQRKLLFMNGLDPRQVAWAQTHEKDSRIVLVAGSPVQVSQKLKKRVYFDQAANLTTRWQITHTPTRATINRFGVTLERIVLTNDETPSPATPPRTKAYRTDP